MLHKEVPENKYNYAISLFEKYPAWSQKNTTSSLLVGIIKVDFTNGVSCGVRDKVKE
jgi:hypothetical protein